MELLLFPVLDQSKNLSLWASYPKSWPTFPLCPLSILQSIHTGSITATPAMWSHLSSISHVKEHTLPTVLTLVPKVWQPSLLMESHMPFSIMENLVSSMGPDGSSSLIFYNQNTLHILLSSQIFISCSLCSLLSEYVPFVYYYRQLEWREHLYKIFIEHLIHSRNQVSFEITVNMQKIHIYFLLLFALSSSAMMSLEIQGTYWDRCLWIETEVGADRYKGP